MFAGLVLAWLANQMSGSFVRLTSNCPRLQVARSLWVAGLNVKEGVAVPYLYETHGKFGQPNAA